MNIFCAQIADITTRTTPVPPCTAYLGKWEYGKEGGGGVGGVRQGEARGEEGVRVREL